MALEDDIMRAISNDLPNQIGQKLKQRLDQADTNEQLLKEREQTINRLSKEVEQLRKLENDDTSLTAREEAITDKERELDLREYKVGVREEFADKGRADMHLMMGTIFKCPEAREYAFNLYGNANGFYNSQGLSQNPSVSLSGDASEKSKT